MRAVVLKQRPAPGTLPDVLRIESIAEPVPGPREAVVQVLASTINIDDIHVIEGTFYGGIPLGPRPRPDRPVTPGSDLAGIVIATGKDVRSVRVGDAVFGVQMPLRRQGAWAEQCAVDERWLTRKPDPVSFEMAAACGVSGLVALSALKALRMRAGMRVVVVGATGGIGAIVVQLAARAGVEVIGVCGPANVERARQLGCSLVLDYHRGPWDRALHQEGMSRVDRVFDAVGGEDTEQMGRRVLGRDGIFVTVVGPERFIGDRALGWRGILAILARVSARMLRSYVRGPRYVLTGPGPGGGNALAEVAAAASAGVLPPIDSTVAFEQNAMREALERAAAHRNHGRIVIQVGAAG
ncbi:MAG TPA: NADP-dependent oxidoreductase [Acidobacteriaceae bacterium]|nr:NADP-dependent oxidoreductase [Acidobacteriaceae bacterium]